MMEFLYAVAVVCLCSGIVSLLSPDRNHDGLSRQIRFVSALAVCAALLAPCLSLTEKEFSSFTLSLPAVTEPAEGEAEAILVERTVRILCRELEEEVANRFSVQNPTLSLAIDSNDYAHVAILSGKLTGEGRTEEAAAYLSHMLGCPIQALTTTPEEVTTDAISS